MQIGTCTCETFALALWSDNCKRRQYRSSPLASVNKRQDTMRHDFTSVLATNALSTRPNFRRKSHRGPALLLVALVIFTLSVIVSFSNFAIAHEASESDVTKRCAINRFEGGGTIKWIQGTLSAALTTKEILAAAEGVDVGQLLIAITAKVMVDGVETPISTNLPVHMSNGTPLGGIPPINVNHAVPSESKEVQLINCTIY